MQLYTLNMTTPVINNLSIDEKITNFSKSVFFHKLIDECINSMTKIVDFFRDFLIDFSNVNDVKNSKLDIIIETVEYRCSCINDWLVNIAEKRYVPIDKTKFPYTDLSFISDIRTAIYMEENIEALESLVKRIIRIERGLI